MSFVDQPPQHAPLKLGCVLVACDSNPHYLSFWPIVKQMWNSLVGVPVKMIYVGHEKPYQDPDIIVFEPIDEWPTATQAQVIRLLYPALLDCSGAIMLSDMDMVPLNRNFFIKGFEAANSDEFVSLRAPLEKEKELTICYVGATCSVWRDMIGVHNVSDVRQALKRFAAKVAADGKHGGVGWTFDQRFLYETVMKYPKKHISSWEWEIPRLCRSLPSEWENVSHGLISRIYQAWYIDWHLPGLTTQRTIDTVLRILNLVLHAERVKRECEKLS